MDTSAFREAIWQYVHRIKGIFDDSYNYKEVNLLLNKQNKFFIKKIVCFPETINFEDFSNIGYQFRPDEKCHIALLATESNKQAELLYALYAIKKYVIDIPNI